MKQYYFVAKNGIQDYDGQTLSRCLMFIGRQVLGRSFGAGNVTVAQAMAAGYSIVPYKA